MRCEFRLEDGSLNLDLTSKILRVIGSKDIIANTDKSGWEIWKQSTGSMSMLRDNKVTLYSTPINMWDENQPSLTNLPNSMAIATCLNDNEYTWFGIDIYHSKYEGKILFKEITDSWSNNVSTKYKDYFRIYDDKGNLLWSTGTLGDAVFRSTRIMTEFGNEYFYSSPNNKRLYVLINELFKGGTYTADETSNMYSNSGLIVKWENNGTAIRIQYASYYDGDITRCFDAFGKLPVTLFELYEG